MNAAETAAAALADLKGAIADLAEAQDWDAHAEIFHDVQEWHLKAQGFLNALDAGYIVTLDRRLKDEDALLTRQFLLRIAGVIAVEPVPETPPMHIAERRALYRMQAAIDEAING